MPSYLDFDSTNNFRKALIGRTLQQPNGPQTFSSNNYAFASLSDSADVSGGTITYSQAAELKQSQSINTYKPSEYYEKDLEVLPRAANLQLYPYFQASEHTLIGIVEQTDSYKNESALYKFAVSNILNNPQGPFQQRVSQNIAASANGYGALSDALNSNSSITSSLISGKQPLVKLKKSITVDPNAKTDIVNFLEVLEGNKSFETKIPGVYLTDPNNPYGAGPSTTIGNIVQDATSVLSSLLGMRNPNAIAQKPSDLFFQYLGDTQKQYLLDNLSYNFYAPDYSSTAMGLTNTGGLNIAGNLGKSLLTAIGLGNPPSTAYIGDDRGNNLNYAMSDFNDRPVRSPYYLSLFFDPIQTRLMQIDTNLSEGGRVAGNLTWLSINSTKLNKLGANNNEWNAQASNFTQTESTNYQFPENSIFGQTQDLLNTLPNTGGSARAHVANAIDQTSRIFQDGDKFMARGSAVQYTDQYGQLKGVEYCRTWTKDRPYYTFDNLMPLAANKFDIAQKKYIPTSTPYRRTNVRRYDSSVMSNTWNLNMAPMSDGNKGFQSSSNIFEKTPGKGDFYAKKYMFSIENLAWKTSNIPGFTVQDLPYDEVGPNGGRVMWFPPYDLKVTDQNSAQWEKNTFVGRPEPIYTYQYTERTGTLSFKIVVDHPSILNLLVREYFKNFSSDEEADNYINAYFAGCQDLDFYTLVRTYTNLNDTDIKLILDYLNNGSDPKTIIEYKAQTIQPTTQPQPNVSPTPSTKTQSIKVDFLTFPNDIPSKKNNNGYLANQYYGDIYPTLKANSFQQNAKNSLSDAMTSISTTPTNKNINDINVLVGNGDFKSYVSGLTSNISLKQTDLENAFTDTESSFDTFKDGLTQLKTDLQTAAVKGQTITMTIETSTSRVAEHDYNLALSIRRSHSIIGEIINEIAATSFSIDDRWNSLITAKPPLSTDVTYTADDLVVSFEELGYPNLDGGKIVFKTINDGQNGTLNGYDCKNGIFNNTNLKIYAPIAYGCRKASVNWSYSETDQIKQTTNNSQTTQPGTLPKTSIVEGRKITSTPKANKPSIDTIKKIIGKTLQESYYFKKIEETDPIVFTSLKEKLKYFHPAFHSTTPEGLNSRLTFLQQCLRPGDTVPISTNPEANDIGARNTSFGPPPICVLRIGDFYHSKVVIENLNITYEDNNWDLNPDGIGVQPMIANVQLQIKFIGGQGLETPVNRLQNALSSNFFANTEMYDERSTDTNTSIGGQSVSGFTKSFLEQLQKSAPKSPSSNNSNSGIKTTQAQYIGTLVNPPEGGLDYTGLVSQLYSQMSAYVSGYNTMYENLIRTYGTYITNIFLSTKIRTISEYDVYTNSGPVAYYLFGLFPSSKGLTNYLTDFENQLNSAMASLSYSQFCTLFGFNQLTDTKQQIVYSIFYSWLINTYFPTFFSQLNSDSTTQIFETNTRNPLITTFDKLNYIMQYEMDTQVNGSTGTNAILDGFDASEFYSNYNSIVTYLNDNDTELLIAEDITPVNDSLPNILSAMLENQVNTIVNLFSANGTLDSNTVKNLSKALNNFITNNASKPLTYNETGKQNLTQSNSNTIQFVISSLEPTTDSTMLQNIQKINSTSPVKATTTLNYYKAG